MLIGTKIFKTHTHTTIFVVLVKFVKGKFVIFTVVREVRVNFKDFRNILVIDKLFDP